MELFAFDRDRALAASIQPEQSPGEFRPPGPHQACQAQHFSPVERKGDLRDLPRLAEVPHLQQRSIRWCAGPLGESLGYRAPNHVRDEFLEAKALSRPGSRHLSVSQYDNICAQPKHLRQNMGDVDHANAPSPQAPDEREEVVDFSGA